MTSVFRKPAMRWAVPGGVAAAVVAAAITVPIIADADSELPERTVADLLVALAQADKVPFAGTVVQSADVGLPELPSVGPGAAGGANSPAAAVLSLLSGSTTARVWYADDETYRVALQDELAESDIVRDGEDVWLWNSTENTVAHATLGAEGAPWEEHPGIPNATHTPSELAGVALGAISGSTEVDVDGTATVAGRPAYELVVRPRTDESLIGSIRLAVDAEHSVPLRARVYDRDGGEPAVEIGFTSVSFDEPDRSVFEFTPPEGSTVQELQPSELGNKPSDHELADAMPSVVGEAWNSVLVFRGVDLGMVGDSAADSPETQALLDGLLDELDPVSGAYGTGVAFQSGLVTALLLDDGRLLVGAVPLEGLEAAAVDPAAAVAPPAALAPPAE